MAQVSGSITWIDGVRLRAEFHYGGEATASGSSGAGASVLVAMFEADGS